MSQKKIHVQSDIEKVFLSDCKTYLVLQAACLDHYVFSCIPQCCNEVYFNDGNGIENLIGAQREFYFVLPDEIPFEGGEKEDQFSFLRITSRKGYCDFGIRNEDGSGWAYSGEIRYEKNGVFPIEKMKEIKEDF